MKLKSLVLSLMLVLAPLLHSATAQVQTDAGNAAKIKADIARRMAYKKTHVNIDMLNGDKFRGRIEQADADKFAIRQDKTKQRIELSYADVRKVKGQGLGTGAKIGIIVGVAAVALAVVVVIAIKNFDPFEGGITAR
jgi:tetrahydromethanopterin S-methyltransferase subunit G